MKSVRDLVERVRAEYLEMPGMKLTARQIQRLCGIDPSLLQPVLDSLVESMFLRVQPDGTYLQLQDTYGRLRR